MIGRIRDIKYVDQLINRAGRLLHGILGYDQVMVYRFEVDGSGKVVSEVKRHGLESFLGQYFPASDIPQQARALYLRSTIRVISDASGGRVPIFPEIDDLGEPLDSSVAHLRSISPVHCEYLRNMGVAASMSISVIVDGRLWGLMLIAMDAEAILAEAGALRVVLVSSSAEAFGRIRAGLPDVAVLDVNLGPGTSIELARDSCPARCALCLRDRLWRGC